MNIRFQTIYSLVLLVLVMSCSGNNPTKELFNSGWQFTISDADIETITNVENWEAVSLPHTPVLEPKVMDGQWQGTCWYKKTFVIPSSAKKQRLILRFEGAMNVSEFWVNGKKVASHLGGYLPVVFDFTDVAKVGESNNILVKLDNTDNPVTGPKPMRQLDFNMYGGLYRDVFLEIKNPLHISDPILANKTAGGGVFVSYPKVAKDEAIVKVLTHVINHDVKDRNFTIKNEMWDGTNLVATVESIKENLSAEGQKEISTEIKLTNPRLWSPKSPALYTLKTKIISNGKEVDVEKTRIGIRRIKITKEKFEINGEQQFLRGINRHQEYPYIGYALSNEAQYRDAVKIKEAGFDYIRLSHYPHSPAFMDACDELGLVVMDAILGWQYYSKDPEFQQQIFKTSRDLIRRDRNHPCAIAWEVSLNESMMDKTFIDQLNTIAHEEYPGDQCYTAGWQEYGYDIYIQARQHRLGHYHESEKPYSVSEYGDWEYYAMNAGLNQDNWKNLLQADRSSRQLLSDGEVRLLQQATNIQEAHNDNFNSTAFSDSYWVMFDYNRGYSDDLEASGIMTIDRIPKFSYYFFKSQRDADEKSNLYNCGPMVHIASWWTSESPLDIRVFSNCDEIELFLNGKSLGKQTPDSNAISTNLPHPPFTFKTEKFKPGELMAKGFLNGEAVTENIVRTPGAISKLQLEVDYSGKLANPAGNDALFVYAKLIDKEGTIVRTNNESVDFSVTGDAMLISPATISTEAGIATALVRIKAGNLPVKIKATSNKLESETSIDVH
ncbi:MAG: DUF4982 domain-containing protein [Bacteroidales bacterium]|nr:DUF4982 domain-containing protein [Bacteroidales bacterium]